MISRLQSKEYSVGSTIAMVGELSEKFELSRYHVQQALTELYRRNLIVCRKKGGIIAVRELFEREKRQIISFDSGKILIVNHIPMTQPWKIVHLNEHFFSALLTPLEAAGYTVVRENIPLIQDEKELHLYIENLIRLHAPKAITVIAGGRDFERIQEMYYLCHNNVFIFTRSGFLKGGGLLSTFGIANCLDGTAAAEAAFSSGASRVIFCYRTSLYVQLWQQERRAGVQLYLRMRKNGPVFVDDFHFSHDLPQGLLHPDTALIAHNDELAAEIIDAAGKAGYTAGKDYKIIGFGDDARFRDYDLTTMRPDLPTIGRRIAEAVLDSCRSFGPIPVQAILTPSILVRRSTL
ncbi:MAG: substrate-binding domain-containing protein [Lentisphaeria bacterium]|nr:substrate-binding domain-containing protein [Lentisphaeria bacterium]